MKKPIPIIVASVVLGLHGAFLIYKQSVNHYQSGAIGNLATLGAFFLAVAVMLSWKVKGWRWVGFVLLLILILSDLGILAKSRTALPMLPVIFFTTGLLVLHLWLMHALARGMSVKKYLSDHSTGERP